MAMKFMITVKDRYQGSAADIERDQRRGRQVFSKWSPPASWKVHFMVSDVDGAATWLLVETDEQMSLLDPATKFGPYVSVEVKPVVDAQNWAAAMAAGQEFRDSIG
jgi:hypothetical protein